MISSQRYIKRRIKQLQQLDGKEEIISELYKMSKEIEFSKKGEKETDKMFILKEFFIDNMGRINISEMDFGDLELNLTRLKADKIYNTGQEATKTIYNNGQKANLIINKDQKAIKIIDNEGQETNTLYNNKQKTEKTIY